MKKRFTMIACTVVLSMIMSIPAWAGQWFSDGYGWRWLNDNGTVPVNVWQWIDGNNDGVAECYCFSPQGYCYLNGRTPDGYMVNASGAWVVNGIVQMQLISPVQNQFTNNTAPVNLLEMEPVDESQFYTTSSAKTTQNQEWLDVGCFYSWYPVLSSHVEYYIGNQYKTLSFIYAPKAGTTPKYKGILEVYGDNDVLLWKSDSINYKTSAQKVSIDITGQQYIKFFVDAKTGSSSVLLKDVLVQ